MLGAVCSSLRMSKAQSSVPCLAEWLALPHEYYRLVMRKTIAEILHTSLPACLPTLPATARVRPRPFDNNDRG